MSRCSVSLSLFSRYCPYSTVSVCYFQMLCTSSLSVISWLSTIVHLFGLKKAILISSSMSRLSTNCINWILYLLCNNPVGCFVYLNVFRTGLSFVPTLPLLTIDELTSFQPLLWGLSILYRFLWPCFHSADLVKGFFFKRIFYFIFFLIFSFHFISFRIYQC